MCRKRETSDVLSSLMREELGATWLAGSLFGNRPRVCAFFNSPDDEYPALLPIIKEGLERRQKSVPRRLNQRRQQLATVGLEVAAPEKARQVELHDSANTLRRGGKFDPEKTAFSVRRSGKQRPEKGVSL
jgi:hypothetical protein